MKNAQLNRWLWRWHVIAGLLLLPFMLLLSVTGSIYLFKSNYENNIYKNIKQVAAGSQRYSYAEQLTTANNISNDSFDTIVLATTDHQATQFTAGRFSSARYAYIDPYTNNVTGSYALQDTLMQKVRKLHGELLLGKYGTKIVELAASWFAVLLITGLFIWWPRESFSLRGFFWLRTNKGKQIFFRDLHAIIGFWTSLVLLVILSGGLPWTDFFGGNYKAVQKWTGSGKPAHYSSNKGLNSSPNGSEPINLDAMVAIAHSQKLPGVVSLKIPQNKTAVFTVKNSALNLNDERVIHFDQYSGEIIKSLSFSDIGTMAASRSIVMRLHQGEFFGFANWLIIFISAILLALASLAAMLSYLIRKPVKNWGLPKAPKSFAINKTVLLVIGLLAILLPLFGLSVLAISIFQGCWSLLHRKGRKKTFPKIA